LIVIVCLLSISACRAPTATTAPPTSTTALEPTRTAFILPTLLPTLTPRPTRTATHTPTLLPTFTATATRPPATATPTADPNATNTPTPTLDPIRIYEQSFPLCDNAFLITGTLTNTVPGAHLPVFPLLNRANETTLWEPLQGLEWIEAETAGDVRAIACIRQVLRQDAVYGDETAGFTARWDIRLVAWPDGRLLGAETFWGDGPPLQNLTGSTIIGTLPSQHLLRWLACDLHPAPTTILCGSGGPLVFAPDGAAVLTAQGAWRVADGVRQAVYSGVSAPGVFALAPDGSLAASANGRDIHLWQPASGAAQHILSGHSAAITGLAFSPDGRWLLSAGQEGSLQVWDTSTGTRKMILAENMGWLQGAAISPDGRMAAANVWGQPGLLYLWDWQAALQASGPLNPLQTIEASEIYINAITFSPDSLLLASAGLDGNVKLWDVTSALDPAAGVRLVGLLPDHADSVTSLAFSPDGKWLASGSADASVIVWNVAKGMARRTWPGAPESVTGVAWSPDGLWLAASSGELIRWWPSP
jgi:hypothetical protein